MPNRRLSFRTASVILLSIAACVFSGFALPIVRQFAYGVSEASANVNSDKRPIAAKKSEKRIESFSPSSVVFSDDFSTNTSATFTQTGQIGASSWSVNRSAADWGARRNTSPQQLELTNDASGTTNANGWAFANVALTSIPSPFSRTLSANPGLVTWNFNMRQILTNPEGFSTDASYGVGFILATNTTAPDFGTGKTGYAVVLGEDQDVDRVRLVRFSGGLQNSIFPIISSSTTGVGDVGSEYLSVRVTYNPSNNQWQLFVRNDGTTAFADPSTGTLVSQGTKTDATFVSTAFSYMGAYWQGSTAANQTAFFDNVSISVDVPVVNNPPVCSPAIVMNGTVGSASYMIDALSNCTTAPDVGEMLSVQSISSQPSGAVANIVGNNIVLTPTNPNIEATYVVGYVVSDGNGGTANTTATVNVGTPEISVTGGPLNFGSQAVGTTSGTRSVTISNTGTGDLNIGQLAKGGTNPSEFTVTENPSNSPIAPGASAKIRVTFTPGGTGNRAASITIPSNDADEASMVVDLSGTGTDAVTPSAVKSMWVWGTTPNVVTDPTARAELISRASANGITDIYLSVYQPDANDEGWLMYPTGDVAAVISGAHAEGIKVWYTSGDPAWQGQSCNTSASSYQRMQEVVAFNNFVAANERFDGVMVDVEPGAAFNVGLYIGIHQCYRGILPAEVKLGTAINAFWEDAVEYPAGGETKPEFQHIIDNAPLDQVVVMGYRDNAGVTGGNGIIGLDEDEIAYASSIGKAGLIQAGVETQAGAEAPNVTFFEEGQAAMDNVIAEVADHFEPSLGFGGFSVHAYGNEFLSGASGWPATPPAPVMSTSTTSLAFGERQIGTTSPVQSFTVSNTGTAPLTYDFTATGDTDQFVITGTTPNTIAPQTSAQIDVQFAPTAPLGAKSVTITITGDDPANTTDSVTLTGSANHTGTFTLSSSTYQVNEDAGTAQVTVNRVNGTLGSYNVTVNWGGGVAVGGTLPCVPGQDYAGTSQTLIFLQGDTSKTATIILCDDEVPEESETFPVSVSSSLGIGFPIATAQLTVLDTDPRERVVDRLDDSVSADECTAAPNDCSLRRAIETSNDGDTITFDPSLYTPPGIAPEGTPLGVIELTGEILIMTDITITGPGASLLTIDGNGAGRIFNIGFNSTVTMSGMKLSGGNGSQGGAILTNFSTSLTLSGMTITGNTATDGGAINAFGLVSITNSELSGNSATRGGGIFLQGGSVTLTDSTVSGNTANTGGGIYGSAQDGGGGNVNMTGSTFSDNCAGTRGVGGDCVAGGPGGGIYYNGEGHPFSIRNSTFSDNSATTGGGLWFFNDSIGSVASSTFSNSSIHSDGQGLGSTLPLSNTIVSGGGCTTSDGGLIGNGGFNIDSGASCGFGSANNSKSDKDPLLGPLQNNGGPTFTMAILPNSPAIDTGSAFGLTTDQRGFTRPIDHASTPNAGDGSDIGAFELQVPTAASASISGRVLTTYGRGVSGVVITVQGSDGVSTTVVTNTLGYYRFDGLQAGETFVVAARSRRYTFAVPVQVVNLGDNIAGLDFRALLQP